MPVYEVPSRLRVFLYLKTEALSKRSTSLKIPRCVKPIEGRLFQEVACRRQSAINLKFAVVV